MSDHDMGWVTLSVFIVIIVVEFAAMFFRGRDDEPFDD